VTVQVLTLESESFNVAGVDSVFATERDVQGVVTLSVTPRGAITFVTQPSTTIAFGRIVNLEGLIRRLYTRLPGKPAQVGDQWSDTVFSETVVEGLRTRTRNVAKTTYSRDTVIGGNQVPFLMTTVDRFVERQLAGGRASAAQILTGHAAGGAIWDGRRHIIIYSEEQASLTGTYETRPSTGRRLPVVVRQTFILRLIRADST
jgi:hypothetical protein